MSIPISSPFESIDWDDPNAESKAFGIRLRIARKALGLSQEALADDLGLHQSTVAKIEGGNRPVTLDEVYRFADALEVFPQQLIGIPHPMRETCAICGARVSTSTFTKHSDWHAAILTALNHAGGLL